MTSPEVAYKILLRVMEKISEKDNFLYEEVYEDLATIGDMLTGYCGDENKLVGICSCGKKNE